MKIMLRWQLVVVAALAAACGDSESSGGGSSQGGGSGAGSSSGGGGVGGAASNTPRGECPAADLVGRFSVERQVDFGVVQGTVADGVVPTSIPELVAEEGGCRLDKRRNLACNPTCVGSETCGENGTCIPYPRQISVGTVTIAGLTKPTTMEPTQPGNTYFAPDADNPPFTPFAPVELSAKGDGTHAAFSLYGAGVEPLVDPPVWVLEKGVALDVTWPAPSQPSDAKIFLQLTIDQHGLTPLSLDCAFDDTGSATVPSTLIDQLIDSGVTGFPNGKIVRKTADHVDIDVGCVELDVGSPISADVSVAGFTPCNGPADCPPNQTCNIMLQICE